MTWKKEVFENFRLYAVTDLKGEDPYILERVDAAYRGGADIVQLRARGLSDRALLELARQIRRVADKRKKLFFVNNRVDLALAAEADGLHLGQDDLPLADARLLCRSAGREFWIGQSTHTLEQALEAESQGASYIGVGPVFRTPTKPDYEPAGLELVTRASRAVKIPCVAIGGIDAANISQVLAAGASRIAAVRAIFASDDPQRAAAALRAEIERLHGTRV